jgi:uncharacterized protein
MSFLNAEWRKLAFFNYEIDPNLLNDYVPFGTEMDLWENKCYISVIGFMFMNTRLLGLKIPFHTDFEEVNLRFYVKRWDKDQWKRGVVFIKEIVPKAALTFVANTIYNEHYETMKMSHRWDEQGDANLVEYRWQKNNRWNSIVVRTEKTQVEIATDSVTEFITEHYWGYASINGTKTNEYEVRHPRWKQYKVLDSKIDVDFVGVYGNDFAFLQDLKPSSVMLAEGSEISVEGKTVIRK